MQRKLFCSMMVLFFSPNSGAQGFGEGPGMRDHDEIALIFPGVLDDHTGPKEGPCSHLKLDASEKAQIKDAYFKFKEQKVDLKSQVEKAHINKEKADSDLSTDFTTAEAASSAQRDAMNKLIQATDTYRNTILYNILKPEQRSAAHACWMHEQHHMHFMREHMGMPPMGPPPMEFGKIESGTVESHKDKKADIDK